MPGTSSEPGRAGVTLLLATVMIFALAAAAGLAVDAGVLYAIRARISASADAGALAGARSLHRGLDIDSQRASAEQTARNFVDANFPAGSWGSSNRDVAVAVSQSGYRMRTVNVAVAVDAPLYFLRLFGLAPPRLRAESTAARREVNMALVLDRSGSLASAGADNHLRACAKSFVDKFAEGRDRVAMVSFSGTTRLDFPASFNFKTASPSLAAKIDAMVCDGNTATAQGLWAGYEQLVALNEAGALNLIVLFTDGKPSALAANFPIRDQSDNRYASTTSWNGATATVSTPASTCSSRETPVAGVLAAYAMSDGAGNFVSRGATFGIFVPSVTGNVSDWTFVARSGCSYASGSPSPQVGSTSSVYVRKDVKYIPATDINGNSTTGYQTAVDRFAAGHPYENELRPDSPRTIRYAAFNAADNAAQRIRANTSLGTIVFTIGLGGTSSEPVDHVFLRRLANDPDSPVFDNTRPAGLYVYAPTAAQLNDAFSRVASEILRLAL